MFPLLLSYLVSAGKSRVLTWRCPLKQRICSLLHYPVVEIRIRTRQKGVGNSSHSHLMAYRDQATDPVGALLGSRQEVTQGARESMYAGDETADNHYGSKSCTERVPPRACAKAGAAVRQRVAHPYAATYSSSLECCRSYADYRECPHKPLPFERPGLVASRYRL